MPQEWLSQEQVEALLDEFHGRVRHTERCASAAAAWETSAELDDHLRKLFIAGMERKRTIRDTFRAAMEDESREVPTVTVTEISQAEIDSLLRTFKGRKSEGR